MVLDITAVSVVINDPHLGGRVLAYVTLELCGCLVIDDIRIIRMGSGLLVAMPSRKLADGCPRCRSRNPLSSAYCGSCSQVLDPLRGPRDELGRRKLHVDVIHPIRVEARREIERAVLGAYREELDRRAVDPLRDRRWSCGRA